MAPTRLNNCFSATIGLTIFVGAILVFSAVFIQVLPRRHHHHHDKGDSVIDGAFERFTTQPLDHSNASLSKNSLQQRYFYVPPPVSSTPTRFVFFYAGNEASVEAYVKSCGMMWENAKEFNAMLVFAEHRFWGKSLPATKKDAARYDLAGPDQAIADYVALLKSLFRNETGKSLVKDLSSIQVIAFGGSYGGMLAAWMRLVHPELISVAVASSAPVLAFPDPRKAFTRPNSGFYDDGGASYWKVVSKVLSPCSSKMHAALQSAKSLVSSESKISLGICDDEINAGITREDVLTWIAYPLETLCMADYSFPSTYITGHLLPARPAQLACDKFLENPLGGLWGIRDAIGVMYNDTGKVKCYHIPNRRDATFYDGLWDQYWCRWSIPQETYFATRGPPNDMFLPMPLDWPAIDRHCNATVGTVPDKGKSVLKWFGAITEKDWEIKASKIVFANGGHDPWSSGGYFSKKNPSLVPLWIPSGAHHADLMFSRNDDPDDLKAARVATLQYIRRWTTSSSKTDIDAQFASQVEQQSINRESDEIQVAES